MTFNKSNIRRLAKFLQRFNSVHIASPLNPTDAQLEKIGFPSKPGHGTTILPSELGPISKFNSSGKEKILKNRPKETVYHACMIKDWHGNPQLVNIPYERYPREKTPPPSEEISIHVDNGATRVISSVIQTENHDRLHHIARLFIELFGGFEILDASKNPLLDYINIKRVNWEILPAGSLTWKQISDYIAQMKDKSIKDNTFQGFRCETLSKTKPDCIYKGIAGFNGYVAFVYKAKNIAIMESFYYGNASYVFDENWKEYSKLTKKEILEGHLHKKRIVHDNAWKTKILDLTR